MLEIFETLKSQADWGETGLFEAMEDLLEWSCVDARPDHGPWPDGRVVCAECVLAKGDDVVGMARLLWDSHIEDSLPRVAHLCLTPTYHTDFVIESLETVLAESYAAEPIAGDHIRLSNGRVLDLLGNTRAQTRGQVGQLAPRVI